MTGIEQLDPSRALREIGRAMRELELALPSARPETVTKAAVNLFNVLKERGLIDADGLARSGDQNTLDIEHGLASMRRALVDGQPNNSASQLSKNLGPMLNPEIRRQIRNLPELTLTRENLELFRTPGGIGEVLGGSEWPNSMSRLAITAVNASLRNGQPLSGLHLKDTTVTEQFIDYIFRKDGLRNYKDQCRISVKNRTEPTDAEKTEILRPYFTIHEDGSLTVGPKLAKYIEGRLAGTEYDLDSSPGREAERKAISSLPAINPKYDRDSLMCGSPFVNSFVGNYVIDSIQAALHQKKPLKDITLFLSGRNIEGFNATWKRDHNKLTQSDYFRLEEDGTLKLTSKLIGSLKNNLDSYGLGAIAATSREEVLTASYSERNSLGLPGQSWQKVAPLEPLLGETASQLLAFFVHRGTSASEPIVVSRLTAQALEREFSTAPKPRKIISEVTETGAKQSRDYGVLTTELSGLFEIRPNADSRTREVRLGPVGQELVKACIEGRYKDTKKFENYLYQLWERSDSVAV